jgi:hypothetical protein
MRGIFAMVILTVMLVSGAATLTLMLYLFGFIGKG